MDITATRLRELLHYEPETGVITWRERLGRKIRAGAVAGWLSNRGYMLVTVDGIKHRAHRLCWFLFYGSWPNGQIDHLDGDPVNNRIQNLRDVTTSVNQQNRRKAQKNNKLGMLGVRQKGGRFQTAIRLNGKYIHIGTFDNPKDAEAAYLTAKRIHHEGCTI